jgi:hypothetical protein
MRKLSLVVVALIAFALPAVSSAKGGAVHKSAAKHCKALRTDMGKGPFRAAFANKHGKHAMDRCVAAQAKAKQAAKRRAKKSCKADGKRGRALKRCVRNKLAAEPAAPEAFQGAVEECQTMQSEDPEAFTDEYGDGEDAFQACVTDHADDESADDSEGDAADDDPVDEEPGDDAVADEPDPGSV